MGKYFEDYSYQEIIFAITDLPHEDLTIYIKYYPDLINRNNKLMEKIDTTRIRDIIKKYRLEKMLK